MAPFCAARTLIVLDGDLDLPQDTLADLANRRAENGHGLWGIEIKNGLEIIIEKVFFGVEAAAFENNVGRTDCCRRAEGDADVVIIIFPQISLVKDVKNIPPMILPILPDKL